MDGLRGWSGFGELIVISMGGGSNVLVVVGEEVLGRKLCGSWEEFGWWVFWRYLVGFFRSVGGKLNWRRERVWY